MKKILLTALIVLLFIDAKSQENDFRKLNYLLNSKAFIFLDSVAYKAYELNYAKSINKDSQLADFTDFVKNNQALINNRIEDIQDEVFEMSINEFKILKNQHPVGFSRFNGETLLKSKLNNINQEIFKQRFKTALYYYYSGDSDWKNTFQYHKDEILKYYRNLDFSNTNSLLSIYGDNFSYTSDYYFRVESDHAVYGSSDGTIQYIIKPSRYRKDIYQEALSGINDSQEFGTLEFSFTRLWYWINKDKVYLQFDKSVNSSALTAPLLSDNIAAMEVLLANNADILSKDHNGRNLLLQAVQLNQKSSAAFFIQKGLSLEEKDVNGYTALLLAIDSKNIALSEFLLENGADYNARTNNNVSTFKLAYGNPRYLNNLLHIYRPIRIGFKLIDFGFAANVFNANNTGTYTTKIGPMLSHRLNNKLNIRHELNYAWSQIDPASSLGEIIIAPDGTFTSVHTMEFTQLTYAPMFRYIKNPRTGVFMHYFAIGPEFSKTLNKKSDSAEQIKNGNIGINLAGGIEAYSNKVGFIMELGISRDLTSMLETIDIKRTLMHLSMGFMF